MEKNIYSMAVIAELCRGCRLKQGIPQKIVAIDTATSPQNVSGFERGLNNNARLLMWYVQHGLSEYIEESGKYGAI